MHQNKNVKNSYIFSKEKPDTEIGIVTSDNHQMEIISMKPVSLEEMGTRQVVRKETHVLFNFIGKSAFSSVLPCCRMNPLFQITAQMLY